MFIYGVEEKKADSLKVLSFQKMVEMFKMMKISKILLRTLKKTKNPTV